MHSSWVTEGLDAAVRKQLKRTPSIIVTDPYGGWRHHYRKPFKREGRWHVWFHAEACPILAFAPLPVDDVRQLAVMHFYIGDFRPGQEQEQ